MIFFLALYTSFLGASFGEDQEGRSKLPYPYQHEQSLKPYSYQYGIKDDYSGVKLRAEESSDAKVVKGSYEVALPDSRIQKVTYTVDGDSGFVANVKYEGVAIYPNHVSIYDQTTPTPVYVPIKKTILNS
nr:cuticle protein 19-like [Lepeophtheirus salmonis]